MDGLNLNINDVAKKMRSPGNGRLRALAALSACLGVAACGGSNHFASYDPAFKANVSTVVIIAPVKDESKPVRTMDMPADFQPAGELAAQLRKSFQANGIKLGDSASDGLVVTPIIMNYQPGSVMARWVSPVLIPNANTELAVTCELSQHNVHVGLIRGRETVESGGLFSAGAWKYVFGRVADDIAAQLKNKLQRGGGS